MSPEPRSWQPREVVDRKNPVDLRYWSERFGVSEDALREAISELGPRVRTLATEFGCVVSGDELEGEHAASI